MTDSNRQHDQHDQQTDMGNVPPVPRLDPPAGDQVSPAREGLDATFKRRMEQEGRWREVSLVRDQMMKDAKKSLPNIEARRAWVYGELDRMYPPLKSESRVEQSEKTSPIGDTDSGSIQGLSDLPADWPTLAENASLSSDIGWVQANRLWIVEERPGKATLVRLERAASPAPSRSALGWLETSIRSYAKYVDVVAKASTGAEDEGAVMRRERKSVDEVRALLAEMEEASDTCPTCGRPR